MRRWTYFVLVIAIFLSVSGAMDAVLASAREDRRPVAISFASSAPGAPFYALVGGMAPYVSERIAGVSINTEATGGSVENIRLLASGESEMGISVTLSMVQAMRGEEAFEGEKYSGEMQAVAQLYTAAQHWVTLAGSGIEDLRDLEGKTVSLGPPGSGAFQYGMITLEALGIADKVDIRALGFSDAPNALIDGHIDAFSQAGALPVPAISQLAQTHDIRLISYSETLIKQIQESHPYFSRFVIPDGGYTGVGGDAVTIGVAAYWLARPDVPEWAVYEILDVVYDPETRRYLNNVHPAWAELSPGLETLQALDFPLHPGAERFYRERGDL